MRKLTKRKIIDLVVTLPFYVAIGCLANDNIHWWHIILAQILLMLFGLWHFHDGMTRIDLHKEDVCNRTTT